MTQLNYKRSNRRFAEFIILISEVYKYFTEFLCQVNQRLVMLFQNSPQISMNDELMREHWSERSAAYIDDIYLFAVKKFVQCLKLLSLLQNVISW